MKRKIRICVDGGGGAKSDKHTYGVRVKDEKTKQLLHTSYGICEVDNATSNVAEYMAMKTGLMLAWLHREAIESVIMQGDSQLVIYHLTGFWTCSKDTLIPHFQDCKKIHEKLVDAGVSVWYDWKGRAANKDADALCHLALEAYQHSDMAS